MPKLTKVDWITIYYALDAKALAVKRGEYTQNKRHKREWIAHLHKIIDTIGPDGENMYGKEE